MRLIPSLMLRLPVQVIFIELSLMFLLAACSGNKYACDANRTRSFHKIGRNKSNYGAVYSPKTKPVPKNYLINNGR